MNAINLESFTVSHPVSEYHYTLYYYDLAGNLIKTVPPEGVHPNRDPQWLLQVKQKRKDNQRQTPLHTLPTVYRYNSLNQVVTQQSPDAGYSRFWYDRLGRLAVSQNAKQAVPIVIKNILGRLPLNRTAWLYSYTLYDQLGRITQVGQKRQVTVMNNSIARDATLLTNWMNFTYANPQNQQSIAEQVTSTVYDVADDAIQLPMPIPVNQKAYTLRNRVSYTRTHDYLLAVSNPTVAYTNSTTYSYDIHGNVDTLLQQYRTGLMAAHADNRFKVMAYKYDLVSGKVNQVHYQPGLQDQLYHRYDYDAENRITDVYTSDNKLLIGDVNLEEHDAHYEYYKHGPLAKTVLGHQRVQGIDYVYTLQGWLKGVNSDSLLDNDGLSSTGGAGGGIVAKDAYRFSLNYFNGDYNAISYSMANAFPGHSGYMPDQAEYKPLYNGNISSMVVGIPKLGETKLYNYGYDQLNRLVSMDAWKGYDAVNMHWQNIQKTDEYKERIAYDANGNILKYLRNGALSPTGGGGGGLNMDSLNYGYNKDANGNIVNNRLRHVQDAVDNANYTEDIDNQSDDNYSYDAIGNLIKDNAEKITNIEWSVYGKILRITKTATSTGDVSAISYTYDAAGNRISKRVEALNKQDKYTWYTRDASGNTMAVYEYEGTNTNNNILYLKEQHLYGSSRLGVWNRNVNMDEKLATTTIPLLGPTQSSSFERGNKFFELGNQVGSILVTVSDKKIGVDANNDGVIDYYEANVITATDYAPFGMQLVGRKFSSEKTLYGFNGKRKDNEVYGEGNAYDFGARISDPRLGGRFFSVDPMQTKYPDASPYLFAANSPIANSDQDGKYALFLHYMLTRYMLMQAGVSEVQANLIAHYASVYSDNPGGVKNFSGYKAYSKGDMIIAMNLKDSQKDNPIFDEIGGKVSEEKILFGVTYNTDIDYSKSMNSQSESDEAQKWHATRTYVEKNIVSAQDAVNRSFTSAWDMLFKSVNEGGIQNMEMNTGSIENFSQALHSFQDIEAHRGAVFRATAFNLKGLFSWNGNEHDLHNDTNPDPARFGIAKFYTGNAILVHQIMSGNIKRLTTGTQISIQGMSADQVKKLRSKINAAGFEFKSNGNNTYMHSVTKKPKSSK